MEEVGIGGYFMHARGGLQTEYLSDEWFDNVKATIREGKNLKMESWGYDENGWPSGFGSGAVNGLGLKYQQKYLRCEETETAVQKENTIINVPCDGKNVHIYYTVNPFYVDTLDGEVISNFIRITHKAYKDTLGDEEPVVFTKSGENINIECTIYERGSVVLFAYDEDVKAPAEKCVEELKPIEFSGDWEMHADDNALTLDYCDVYFDGDLAYENMHVNDVQEKAIAFNRKVNTKVVFKFNVKKVAFTKFDLVVETPENFDIVVNVTAGDFHVTEAPKNVKVGNLAEQGYPFFAGSVTFKKTVNLTSDEIKNRSVKFQKLCSTVTKVRVNGQDMGKIMWQPYEVDVTSALKESKNIIEITVTGNLRNLLGPFHLKAGEAHSVGPCHFFHESPIWCKGINPEWVDTYCFVEFGLFF